VTWTGSQFIAVAQVPENVSNAIFTSPNGVTWTAQDAGIVNASFLAVAGSPTVQIAVGGATISATDAKNWTLRMVGTSRDLHTAVKGHDIFIAAGSGGAIEYSRDSLTWLPAFSPTTQSLFGSASSGSTIVLVGANGTILESVIGTTWADHSYATTNTLQSVTWAGTQFVAVGANGMVLTSPDAMTWTPRNSGTTSTLNGVTWDGTHVYAVGNGGVILVSTDAVTWSALPSPTTHDFEGVTWTGAELGIAGLDSLLYSTSDNGVSWSKVQMESGLSQSLYGVTWNPEAQEYIVAAATGLWGGYGFSWENFGGPFFTHTLYGAGARGRIGVGMSGIIFADTDAIFFDAFSF
jgi:photosystem II stability/assembly factor-like uncharacterized protein